VQSKDWNGLLSYAQGWTQAEPENATAWFYLGNTYGIGLNDPASAAPAFKHAVSINPNWPEAWNALGQVYAASGRYQQAADALSRATQLAPERPSYWNNLATVCTDQKVLPGGGVECFPNSWMTAHPHCAIRRLRLKSARLRMLRVRLFEIRWSE